MKLYEFAPTRSIRVRWTLQELEVPFEAVSLDLRAGQGQTPEYLRINPTGKVPALVDGDFVLTESVAIVLYLGEKYPEKRFVPTDPKLRAQLHRWLMFTATELEQPLWRIARNSFLYPRRSVSCPTSRLRAANFARWRRSWRATCGGASSWSAIT
jgi:glutathione S-transferase